MLRQTSNRNLAHDKTHTMLDLNRFKCVTIQIYLLKLIISLTFESMHLSQPSFPMKNNDWSFLRVNF